MIVLIWNFSNYRFVVVCGDGEYIIYTAMALRNKSFGSAQEFVWAADSSEYAIRENSKVKLFKNFKEKKSFKPDYGAESTKYILMIHLNSDGFVLDVILKDQNFWVLLHLIPVKN